MKIQNSFKTAIAALVFGASSHAMGTPITLNASGIPSYLNNNNYQGNFDGSAVLPGQFTINSIGFTFTFADDASDPFSDSNGTPVTTSSVSTVTLPTGDKNVTTTTTVTKPVTRTGEQEAVSLAFGSLILSGQTTAGLPVLASTTVLGSPVLASVTYAKNNGVSCTAAEAAGNSACKTINHYTVTNTVTNMTTTDYSGNIALGGSLLAYNSLLAELMQNKVLNFGLGATGDLNLVNASLNLDYTDTIPAQPSNDVPEPGSLALFGIALIGVAGARRARRC